MQWSTLDTSILHAYRYAYRLSTPSAFSSQYNQIILSRPDIGRLSPTMARRRDQRRQSREQLANTVRKHFNGLGIQENEVIVDFLYKVKWQGGSLLSRVKWAQANKMDQTRTFVCALVRIERGEVK